MLPRPGPGGRAPPRRSVTRSSTIRRTGFAGHRRRRRGDPARSRRGVVARLAGGRLDRCTSARKLTVRTCQLGLAAIGSALAGAASGAQPKREELRWQRRRVSLKGQVVAITGGARGIGRATARALVLQGRQGRDRRPRPRAGRAHRGRDRRRDDRPRARRHPPRLLRGLPRPGRGAPRLARRARQQRRDHAPRALRRRGRPDRAAAGRHQRARGDVRDEAGPAAHAAPRPRPPRQPRLAGGQGRVPGRRHLLRHQALRRRRLRGRPRGAARHRHRDLRA